MPSHPLTKPKMFVWLAMSFAGILHAQTVTAKTVQGFPSGGKLGRLYDFVIAEVTEECTIDGRDIAAETRTSITARVQPDGSVLLRLDTVWLSGAMLQLESDPGVVHDKNGKPVPQSKLKARVHHGFFTLPKNTVISFTNVVPSHLPLPTADPIEK